MDKVIKTIYSQDLTGQDVEITTNGHCPIHLYRDLLKFNHIKEVIGGHNACIVLFPVKSSTDGHWITILYHPKTNTIEHWDSYGLSWTQELKYSQDEETKYNILGQLYDKAKKEGYNVVIAYDGIEAIQVAKKEKPDLIILDIMMPRLDGIGVCEHLRSIPEFEKTLITFLTALGDEISEIKGLNVGADDYIVKPIKPKLLVTRVKALLRRLEPTGKNLRVEVGNFTIDKEQYLVRIDGNDHNLPRKEFELFH
mgnify:CR=1 FL=1